MKATECLSVCRCWLAQDQHGRRIASRNLGNHGYDRQSRGRLDLIGATEGMVVAFAHQRHRTAKHQSAGGTKNSNQRLWRIAGRLSRSRGRHQLGVGLEDVLGTYALL